MGIGGSIFLIAVGAIVAFGVRDRNLGPLDLTVIGWVLMLAGLAGLLITLWVWNSRKRRVITTVSPTPPTQHVERQQVVNPTRREVVAEDNWSHNPQQSSQDRPL
jgi:Domain of unknown function (DUF6458)